MIISFTGAQSTGKSTLLNMCKEQFGNKFEYFPEITRQIKNNISVNINELGDSLTQYLIMSKHIENMFIAKQHAHVFLDRCALDGLVYTRWLHQKHKVSNEVIDCAHDIFNRLIHDVDVIFYTDPADVKLVDDGERSTSISFRNEIISLFELHIDRYIGDNKVIKLSGTIDERMNTIKETLKVKGISL
jgi:nicotinamide riboside kinase